MREDISLKQGFSMLFIFLSGAIMAIGGGSEAGRDSYISALFCILFVVPLYFLYYTPFLIFKEKNFFEIIDIIYGKFFSNIINLIYVLSVLLVCVVSFSRYTLFIKTVSLQNTNIYVIGIFMAITCIYAVYCGYETLARFCEIMFFVVILSIIFFIIVSIPLFKAINLQPVLENGVLPLITGMYSLTATPFMEGFALIMLMSQSRKRKDMKKIIFISAISSAITISIIFLRNLLILGFPAIESLYYPSYLAISLVSLGDFFERQEVSVSIIFLIADIVKISSLSIFLCKIINFKAKTFEYKYYAPAIIMLVFTLSMLIFRDTMQLFRFFNIYKYILTIPFLIIPIITFSFCKFKKTKL